MQQHNEYAENEDLRNMMRLGSSGQKHREKGELSLKRRSNVQGSVDISEIIEQQS